MTTSVIATVRSAAIFFDRDGILIRDINLMTSPDDVELIAGAADAVLAANQAGFLSVVTTNQSVVARGLCTEDDVRAVHQTLDDALFAKAGARIDDYRFCPHHPNANNADYRTDCACRKPKPGMLLEAAEERAIDLSRSWMIGDRLTDVLAGYRAGCSTILVRSPGHDFPLLSGVDASELVEPDHEVEAVGDAIALILAAS